MIPPPRASGAAPRPRTAGNAARSGRHWWGSWRSLRGLVGQVCKPVTPEDRFANLSHGKAQHPLILPKAVAACTAGRVRALSSLRAVAPPGVVFPDRRGGGRGLKAL